MKKENVDILNKKEKVENENEFSVEVKSNSLQVYCAELSTVFLKQSTKGSFYTIELENRKKI
jgi:hypothetical protein